MPTVSLPFTSETAEGVVSSVFVAMGIIILTIAFFIFILPYFKARLAAHRNQLQINLYENRIKTALERWVHSEAQLTPCCERLVVAEIRKNLFGEWRPVYIFDDCETSIDLPWSVWYIMQWLAIRRKEPLARLAKKYEDGEFASISVKGKFRLLHQDDGLPDIIRHGHQAILDRPVRDLFPEITQDLLHYRDLVNLRNAPS